MEILCKNDKFSSEQLEFFKKFGVILPKEGKIYNLRKVVKGINGKNGFLLQEIVNPEVPLKSPLGYIIMTEPNFAQWRFSTLSGDEITREALQEFKEEEKGILEKIPLKSKENDKILCNMQNILCTKYLQ